MIIDQEGEIITQGDTPNNRHKWTELNSRKWTCTKCECTKHKIDEKSYYYNLNGIQTISAPKCENTKITIIKNSKNERKKDTQLSIW